MISFRNPDFMVFVTKNHDENSKLKYGEYIQNNSRFIKIQEICPYSVNNQEYKMIRKVCFKECYCENPYNDNFTNVETTIQ